jgi:uncharacterized membrane protein
MNHWLFLFRLNQKRVTQAIAQAESRTTGEIRVFVTHRKCAETLSAAQAQFDKLGMSKTKHRNAVLIFIAPRTRKFAVIGDHAVHEKCGDAFWRDIVDAMSAKMRAGGFTDAIVHAVEKAGALLAEHFPSDAEKVNELPDEIATD